MLNSSHGDHCEGMNIRHITANIPSVLVRALCIKKCSNVDCWTWID